MSAIPFSLQHLLQNFHVTVSSTFVMTSWCRCLRTWPLNASGYQFSMWWNVIQSSLWWRNDIYAVGIITQQKPDECKKITVQFRASPIQYNANTIPFSSKTQIPHPWAKCRDVRSSGQLLYERQFLKFVPFKAPGFLQSLTAWLDRWEFRFLGCRQNWHAQSSTDKNALRMLRISRHLVMADTRVRRSHCWPNRS